MGSLQTLFRGGPEDARSSSGVCRLISFEELVSRGPNYADVGKVRDGLVDIEGEG